MRNGASNASIVRMLESMIKDRSWKKSRDIGLSIDPVISLNTAIKNISFLRKEFGDGLILDDHGKHSPESDEYSYIYNPKHVLIHGYCKDISNKNRVSLNVLIEPLKKNDLSRVLELKSIRNTYPEWHREYQEIKGQLS